MLTEDASRASADMAQSFNSAVKGSSTIDAVVENEIANDL
jgi:hypothetical protein